MRLIDADALKKAINNIIDEEIEIDEKWAKGLKYSLKIIDNTPTIPLPDFKEGYKQAILDGKNRLFEKGKKWGMTIDYDRSRDVIPIGCEENNEVIICKKENNGTDDRWDRIIILNTEKVIV